MEFGRLSTALGAITLGFSLSSAGSQRPRDAENLERRARHELSEMRRDLHRLEQEAREGPREERLRDYRENKIRDYLGQARNLERELDRRGATAELKLRLRRLRINLDRFAAPDAEGGRTLDTPAGTGSISGRVTDAVTGFGVSNVDLDVYDSSGFWVDHDYTNSLGGFAISGLSDGAYFLRTFQLNNYIDELYDDISCATGCDVTTGTPVAVAVGAAVTGIDFALDRGGSILGTVRAADSGLGLDSASLVIYDVAGDYARFDSTDRSGAHEVSGLPTGIYFAVASHRGFYLPQLYESFPCAGGLCDPTAGTSISVRKNETTTGIDFSLPRGGLVSGTISDAPSGIPLEQARVTVFDAEGRNVASAWSNGIGQWVSDTGLETGNYFAIADPREPHLPELYENLPCYDSNCDPTTGTPIPIAVGSIATGIDFALDRGGTIEGAVVEVSGAHPIVAGVDIYDSVGWWVGGGASNSAGRYRVEGLAPGSYFALVEPPDPYVAELFDDFLCFVSCNVTGGTPIPVSIATTSSGIDFGLVRGGAISGRVTETSMGVPLENVWVEIYSAGGSQVTLAFIDASGSFTTRPGLPTGVYFAATRNFLGYWDELFDDLPCPGGGCDPTTGTGIAVTTGAVTGAVDFVLDTLYAGASDFYTLNPCRAIDTRSDDAPALQAGVARLFDRFWRCSVPRGATAIAVSITVTGPTADGHLRLYPGGGSRPDTSSINYRAGMTRSSHAVIPLNSSAELSVFAAQGSGTVHLVLDVAGYFR